MANNVTLTVKTELDKVVEMLKTVKGASEEASRAIQDLGKKTGETYQDQTKKVENYFDKMARTTRSVGSRLKDDFKALMSVEALAGGMKLSSQFKNSIGDTISLNDTIRKLGGTFGIAGSSFAAFQEKMMKGLGDIGLGSESAANALGGLAQTPVRGQDNLMGYSQQAGMLASATRTKGSEGEIAKGMSDVLVARGQNPNDMNSMKTLAEDLRRVFLATGKGPADTLNSMRDLFGGMTKEGRAGFTSRGAASLAATSQVAGPNSTAFLEQYLKTGSTARMAIDAQGGKGIIGANGLDVEKFKVFFGDVMKRAGGDSRLAASTLGLSGDAADGFVRLGESLDAVKAAQEGINNATGDLETTFKSTMGLTESFGASVNKMWSKTAPFVSKLTQGATDLLSGASKSDAGSAAVVGGGAVTSALLTGAGIKGVASAMGIGAGGATGGAGAAGAVGGLGMGAAAGAGVAGLAAAEAAKTINEPGGLGQAAKTVGLDELAKTLDKLEKAFSQWGAKLTGMYSTPQEVRVTTKDKTLQLEKKHSRGGSN